MKILAVDTTTRIGSIALCEGATLVAEKQLTVDVTHTEKLLPAIETILQKNNWKVSDLEGLAVSIGPGSFTGLRIGLATMKAIAQAHDIPLVGVSSLLALAYNALPSNHPIAAVLDAGRGEVYTSVIQFGKSAGDGSGSIPPEQDLIRADTCRIVEGGDGPRARQDPQIFRILMKEQAIRPELLREKLNDFKELVVVGNDLGKYYTIQARSIGALAWPRLQKGEGRDWKGLQPNYLRASDAELK